MSQGTEVYYVAGNAVWAFPGGAVTKFETGGLSMRRIALCLFAFCLILPAFGCKKEETTVTPAPAADADADGATDAADDAPADPAEK